MKDLKEELEEVFVSYLCSSLDNYPLRIISKMASELADIALDTFFNTDPEQEAESPEAEELYHREMEAFEQLQREER